MEEQKAAFARQGLNVASVSYDRVETLHDFAARKRISYPMLSDPESKMIRAFGISNETVPKDSMFYGIPYPGTFVVDASGTVRSKFFEPDYRERYTAGAVLLNSTAGAAGAGWTEMETSHLKLRYRASDAKVAGGSRVLLQAEVSLKKGMHVYAPQVTGGYIPVKWDIAAGGPWKAADARWPESKTLHLKAINETLPVYESGFTVTRDLTFLQQKELLAAAGESGRLEVRGTFRYQACDDRQCFPPVNIPLVWNFTVGKHDSQRSPEALRHK